MLRRFTTLAVAFALLLPLGLTAAVAGVDGGTGTITVVHGIPGVTVDVFANGDPLLDGFAPETVTEPIEVPAGTYDLALTVEDGDPMVEDDVILEGSVELAPGGNVTVTANLMEDGTPTLTAFSNDTSQIVGDNARLTVRHTAEAPSVDVWASGSVLIEDFTNPQSVTLEVPAGDYPVALSLPDMTDVIFDAGTLSLAAGTHTIVYAIGTFPDTFTVVAQVIDGLEPATGYGVVSVVHGIPGLTVDAYLNGQLAIAGFEPGTVVGPLVLPATGYDVALYAAGADPLVDTPALSTYVTLPAGANASIVAWLQQPVTLGTGANPALSVFVNDTSEIADGNTRLTVRHVADAPSVDVRADGAAIFENLPNGESAEADVPAGDYAVDLTLPGDSDPVFDAGTLSLAEGTSYTVYAIGTFPDTFQLLIQPIVGLGAEGAFTDDGGSVHEGAIDALAAAGIVLGKGDGTFGEADRITRGQLASIIARSLGLSSDVDAFSDDDGTTHEAAINAIAAVGITQGKADGTFGPNDRITRAQAASFIARALALTGGADAFPDDDGSVHEAAINALAAAGIAQGKADGTFGPDDTLSRGQMASLWARALGLAA